MLSKQQSLAKFDKEVWVVINFKILLTALNGRHRKANAIIG